MINNQELAAYTPREVMLFFDRVKLITPGFNQLLSVAQKISHPTVQSSIVTLHKLFAELSDLSLSMNKDTRDLENKIEQARILLVHIKQNLTVLFEEIKSSKTEGLKLFLESIDEITLSSNFLVRPVGLKEMVWLVSYKLNALQSQKSTDVFQNEIKQLLQSLLIELRKYKEGNISPIDNVVFLTSQFIEKHPDKIKELPWIQGVNQEGQIMQKRSQANKLREQLDEIYTELLGKKNQAELSHVKKLKELTKKYRVEKKNIKEPTTAFGKGWKKFKATISYFNLAKDERKAKFFKKKALLNEDLKKQLHSLTTEHHQKYHERIGYLEDGFRRIEKEVSRLDSHYVNAVVMPLSFQSHRQIKELIVKNGGMMIGGLAQNKVVALGSSNGLCYGFTKAWILLMNTLRGKGLEDYEMIDALNLYGKKSEEVKTQAIGEVNSLVLNEKVYQYYDEQHRDRSRAKVKKNIAISGSFPAKALATLEETQPPSLIITIKNNDEGSHAIGLAKTNHGLWFHDSNYTCVYFPFDKEGYAEKNFVTFLENYLKTIYPKYTIGTFISLGNTLDPTLVQEDYRHQNWSPSYLLSKQIPAHPQNDAPHVSHHRKPPKLER